MFAFGGFGGQCEPLPQQTPVQLDSVPRRDHSVEIVGDTVGRIGHDLRQKIHASVRSQGGTDAFDCKAIFTQYDATSGAPSLESPLHSKAIQLEVEQL